MPKFSPSAVSLRILLTALGDHVFMLPWHRPKVTGLDLPVTFGRSHGNRDFKKEVKTFKGNYRPISALPTVSNVFGRRMGR